MTPKEYLAQELAKFERAFDGKRLRPLFMAVELCHANQAALPDWAALGVLNVILERQHLRGERGAGNSPKGLARKDFVDHKRWHAVTWALKRRGLPPEPQRARGKPTVAEQARLQEYREAYEEARERLTKQAVDMPSARGNLDQIKASFERVQAAKQAGSWIDWD